jgi:uncharacterized protein (UPF0264 family)
MRLLVSVADTIDAAAALAGGADVIDAKDPRAGALGAVSLTVFRGIHACVGGARPVSAALGDATDEARIASSARAYADAGAAFVKVGFDASAGADRIERLLAAAVRGATHAGPGACGVVAVAYADEAGVADVMPDIAARVGARGVLLDTAHKHGPGLCQLCPPRTITGWVRSAQRKGLFVALAGKLDAHDLAAMAATGADLAGVRGAACDGGRTGHVTAERVRRCLAGCATFGTFQEAT